MRRAWFRSTLFNIAFVIVTAIMCVVYIPGLLLPRTVFTGMVRFWIYVVTFLEYAILGLKFEIRGLEHLPVSGSYIVAAKHQSTYETIKLRILFDDPAIILKKELLRIPFWGAYLKKSGVIAIDRSTPDSAIQSIEAGAREMKAAGRPIVIFPQGTRVWPQDTAADKPYKVGIARIQEATGLPIIPMALNSGIYWPRSGWGKSPGTVVFEFFPPVEPGMERRELVSHLEEMIEEESNRLMNEARADALNEKRAPVKAIIFYAVVFTLFFMGYSYAWSVASKKVLALYVTFMKDVAEVERIHADPVITGYPGPIRMTVAEDSIRSNDGSVHVQNLVMTGWPIPFVPVHVQTGIITVKSFKWTDALVFDSLDGHVGYMGNLIDIKDSSLKRQDFEAQAEGTIDIRQEPFPKFDMNLTLKNFTPFIGHLSELKILKDNQGLFINAGLTMMGQGNEVTVPITQNGSTLYAGPLPVASLPAASHQEPGSQPDPAQ